MYTRKLHAAVTVLGILLSGILLSGCPRGSGEVTCVSTEVLDFGLDQNQLTFTVSNCGGFFTLLQFTVEPQNPWITVSPTQGQSFTLGFGGSVNPVTVTVTIDRQQLVPGLNQGIILVGAPDPYGGIKVVTVRATMPGGEGEGEGSPEGQLEGEGQVEGEGGAEGEGQVEGEIQCPQPCEVTCTGPGLNAGIANAIQSLYQLPTVGLNPDTTDLDQNGIVDKAHGQLLDTVLANTSASVHCCVRQAWDNNNALVSAALDLADPGIFVNVPRPLLQTVLSGLATIAETRTLSLLSDLLLAFGVPLDVNTVDTSAAQYMAGYGDADLDHVCNLGEYRAVVTGPGDFLTFVIVAIDYGVSPNGGGCPANCYASEGEPEGSNEGNLEGALEGEGSFEGSGEGEPEGTVEGSTEGSAEGSTEGSLEGAGEGEQEGTTEGTLEGTVEGEGQTEGTLEGTIEGEGQTEGTLEGTEEGEGSVRPYHAADWREPYGVIDLSELLRVIQFYNFDYEGQRGYYSCATSPTEDGYQPGPTGPRDCPPHSSDYNPQDWRISVSELLRLIQFFNMPGGRYHACPGEGTEDGFCPGA